MIRPNSSASLCHCDSLGGDSLFYVPTRPPPAFIVDAMPQSRWSMDSEDLQRVHAEAVTVVRLAAAFQKIKRNTARMQFSIDYPPPSLPLPISMEPSLLTPVQQLWGTLKAFAKRLWASVSL